MTKFEQDFEVQMLLYKSELIAANDLILDLFAQGCRNGDKYDHLCISSYENAQDYLIERGMIKPEECSRKQKGLSE